MKQYQQFILALVFIGTLLSSFHYHEDGHTSEECQVCIVEHNLVGADPVDSTSLQELACPCDKLDDLSGTLVTQGVPKNRLSRAPPFYS